MCSRQGAIQIHVYLKNMSQTFWHQLPIFQVDLHCALHRVATSSCCGHVNELATEPFLLLHREHGTGYRRSWDCRDQRTCFVVIWKHFCFILSTGTRIRTDSLMRPRSSSRRRNTSASVIVTVTFTFNLEDRHAKVFQYSMSQPFLSSMSILLYH